MFTVIIGQSFLNPIALRKAKIVHNFGLSECNRVKSELVLYLVPSSFLQRGITFRISWRIKPFQKGAFKN